MTAVRWRHAGGLSSWHLLRDSDRTTTLCGRQAPKITPTNDVWQADELPGDERTCERCAVLSTKRPV